MNSFVLFPIAFNIGRAHATTRAIIEQVNGQLKNKFRCLLGHGMQIVPEKVCDIIFACCVLFNISKQLRGPHLDPEDDQQENEEDAVDGENVEDDIAAAANGAVARAEIVHNFFG